MRGPQGVIPAVREAVFHIETAVGSCRTDETKNELLWQVCSAATQMPNGADSLLALPVFFFWFPHCRSSQILGTVFGFCLLSQIAGPELLLFTSAE